MNFILDYGLFILIIIALIIFVPFFVGLLWDEVIKPSIYGPDGTWRQQ